MTPATKNVTAAAKRCCWDQHQALEPVRQSCVDRLPWMFKHSTGCWGGAIRSQAYPYGRLKGLEYGGSLPSGRQLPEAVALGSGMSCVGQLTMVDDQRSHDHHDDGQLTSTNNDHGCYSHRSWSLFPFVVKSLVRMLVIITVTMFICKPVRSAHAATHRESCHDLAGGTIHSPIGQADDGSGLSLIVFHCG